MERRPLIAQRWIMYACGIHIYFLPFLVRFRAVPLLANGRRFLDPIDIFLHDPSGIEMARWTARNAVSGPIHVSYHLASETPVGKWRLSASSRSSRPASHLSLPVVKYEPIGFEVRIWMPASVIPMDNGLRGWIEAKRLGDGLPIFGQLRLTAKVKSSDKGNWDVVYCLLTKLLGNILLLEINSSNCRNNPFLWRCVITKVTHKSLTLCRGGLVRGSHLFGKWKRRI